MRYEYHWKAAEKSFPMILTFLKSNKKGPLLFDQGRSSGDFVSNFQLSYFKNYLIEKLEIWCETFSHLNLRTNMPNFSKIGDGRQKNAEKDVS